MQMDDEIIKILEENTAEHLAVYMSCHTPNGIVLVSPADILDIINCKNAEIERLQKLLDDKCDRRIAKDRAEAVKEFAERLKEHREIVGYDRDLELDIYGAICFDGKSDRLLSKIENFKTWYQKDVQTMAELKPCPFCGSKATLHERSDGFYVDCATQLGFCGVMPSTWVCKTEDEAMEMWNRRADNAT